MPTLTCVGYFRLNRERLKREMARKGIESYAELGRRLDGAVSQSTLDRVLYDLLNPSSSVLYALTTLLEVRVEDIFDPIPEKPPVSGLTTN